MILSDMLDAGNMNGPAGQGKALHPSERAPYLLVGLIVLLTAAIGGIAWKFHLQQKTAFESEVKSRLLTIANNKVRQINEWRQVRMGEARAVMDDPLAIAAFQRVIEHRATAAERRQVESLLESMCRNLHYAGARLMEPEGRTVVSAGRRFGDDAHLRELTEMVMRQGDIVERDFHNDSYGATHLGLNLPLRAAPGGAIFGVLLLPIDPQDYLYPLHAWPVPTRSGEVLLVRPEGDSVLFLTDLKGRPGSALNFRIPRSRSEVAAVTTPNGAQGNPEVVDYRGVPVFAAVRPVPETPWYLIAKVDSEEVWEPMRRGSAMLGATALSLALTAGTLLFLLWRRRQARVGRELYESAAARRALAEQYDYLSRFANDVILLLDPEGAIVRANDRASQVYGYLVEDFARMHFRDLQAPDAERVFDADWRLSADRASLVYESRHRSLAGREFPVEISMRAVDMGGRLYRQAILRDISERKLAELELSQSEARLRQLVEHAPYGIVVVDGLEILYSNPAAQRLFGAARGADLTGHSLLRFVSPTERAEVTGHVRQVRSGTPVGPVERRYLRLDGKEFWASVSATAIEYNECPATMLFYQDITGTRRAAEQRSLLEAQLREAQKMESMGRLAGGVAHDFNNYLTVINGYCDMLLGDAPSGGELHEGLQEIRAAGERAASVTAQLLAFSHKQVVAPRLVCLNQIVNGSGKILRRLIGEHIDIVTRLQEDLADVIADPGQMDQVLMNLSINARDAMPSGGRIVIETRRQDLDEAGAGRNPQARPGSYVVLSVSDTGAGIPLEVQDKIFEPFFTTKAVGHGTGLGLCTTYGIVREAGGWIEVESAPGCGATFRIWLPAARPAPATPVVPKPAAEKAQRDATLLVVEDQADVRRLALSILKRQGYRLLEAENGDHALALSDRHAGAIDLLLTDVVMPGMTGRELADQLVEKRPGLKVLYMSGYSGDAIACQGFLEPGMAYLPKPFTAEQLSGKVSDLLRARGRGTILVIDDDTAVCGLLRQILTGAGYRVLMAADGKRGMEALEREPVNLVITDIVMPVQEGLETVTRLHAQHPGLPVIAISGAFGGSFLKAAGMLGASATLPKPISAETLLRTVEHLVGEHPPPVGAR
jgi:PAS domain S-box-containing protein